MSEKKDKFDASSIPLATMMELVEIELLMSKFANIFGEMSRAPVVGQAKWKLFLIQHREEFAKIVSLFDQGFRDAMKEDQKH